MKLYNFYQSSAAYRVRIAIYYKNIDCEFISVNLRKGEQYSEEYKEHNKQARVPTLVDGDVEFGQSSAILEYLEEKYPEPSLLPKEKENRAWVRYISQIIIGDMHSVMNYSSVVTYLKEVCLLDETQIKNWYHHWLKQGFDALEGLLSKRSDSKIFCWGEQPTIADLCLIPQIYNAFRFEFSMDKYPGLMRIYTHCSTLSYFERAKPENQADYPNT